MYRGYVYIFRTFVRMVNRHIWCFHKPLVKSAFPRHFTKTKPKTPLRHPLRQNIEKSSISPLTTSSKIATLIPKIPSNPYKSILLSNSTENTIFNKEITHQNYSIYNSSIQQNTSKINTFTIQHKSKFHSSIEVQKFITS